ncbi:hypothetical protein SAMN06295974_3132 [Plantibacter flavus]|uniref:Uncharacterized protein n=1 Tax=Plantibacter flavus TaxID=150123 RepID=A0A3N2C419_9MICO|nr:hypothetical protein [Plantibacter flavus]ROR82239.1 hypothetical protein EDD42_2327 [Plantibacter flavus]SMG42603.1 hypothetical protein SAMN06295974_3132 [Plantibacter flavus]
MPDYAIDPNVVSAVGNALDGYVATIPRPSWSEDGACRSDVVTSAVGDLADWAVAAWSRCEDGISIAGLRANEAARVQREADERVARDASPYGHWTI